MKYLEGLRKKEKNMRKSLASVKRFIIKIDIREIYWNAPAAGEN